MVNVPLMIVDTVQQLALHFPLSVSIGVAVSRALAVAVTFSLPALMLGAVTRSLADAFVFGIVSAIGLVFLDMFATSFLSPALRWEGHFVPFSQGSAQLSYTLSITLSRSSGAMMT